MVELRDRDRADAESFLLSLERTLDQLADGRRGGREATVSIDVRECGDGHRLFYRFRKEVVWVIGMLPVTAS